MYRGDYLTYERGKEALMAMANSSELTGFIPGISDFHLQMELDQVLVYFILVQCFQRTLRFF